MYEVPVPPLGGSSLADGHVRGVDFLLTHFGVSLDQARVVERVLCYSGRFSLQLHESALVGTFDHLCRRIMNLPIV